MDLDVPEDQVVGATGVPVCGDPGWERANRNPSRPVEYQRDYYGASTPSSRLRAAEPPAGRRIRWYAEDVHHFALSLNPDYRYEGGGSARSRCTCSTSRGTRRPGAAGSRSSAPRPRSPGSTGSTGKFAWPQITNVHRIEGGGTEFPMMIMDGSADQGLIVHELGHNYTMGILANNEWREGWLDEGFTSFQTTWFWETIGKPRRPTRTPRPASWGWTWTASPSRPACVGEDYRDFTSYNITIYTPGRAVLPPAPLHRGRRRRCTGSCRRSTSDGS